MLHTRWTLLEMRKDAPQRDLPEASARHYCLHQGVEAPDLATIKEFFSLLYRYELRQDARSSILGSGNLVGDSRYTTSHSPALKPPPLRRETYLQDRTSKQCIVPWPNWETMMECPLICRSWAQLTSQLDPPFQHPGHAYAQVRSARFRSIQPNTP